MIDKNKIRILVIPDVHARNFWREPVGWVLANTNVRVIFLGDFLSPYPDEFELGVDYKTLAIETLEDILKVKKTMGKFVTLLLGNHDCSYRFTPDMCECRTDYENYPKIKHLFVENKDLFQLADEEYIGDRHFIFSHAGIHKGYVKFAFPNEYGTITEKNVVDWFNNAYLTEDECVINTLGMYDVYRGWGGYDYGSLVWADLHSWFEKNGYDGYGCQVFGHTQLQHGCGGFINKNIACLDSAEAFVITDAGEIIPWNKLKEELV